MDLTNKSTAQLKAERRKASRKLRAVGDKSVKQSDGLLKQQKRAEAQMGKRITLGDKVAQGDRAAAKERRKLNDTWYNRESNNMGDYFKKDQGLNRVGRPSVSRKALAAYTLEALKK